MIPALLFVLALEVDPMGQYLADLEKAGVLKEDTQPAAFGERPVQHRDRAEEVLIDRRVNEHLGLRRVLPDMPKDILGDALAAGEPIHHVLIFGVADLHDDVVDRCLRLRPLHQPHTGRSGGLVRHHDRSHVAITGMVPAPQASSVGVSQVAPAPTGAACWGRTVHSYS